MSFSTNAIVLRLHPVREADAIVWLLTEDRGRISAVARGVRKSKKRFLGGIDILDCGLFELEPTRNNPQLFTVQDLSQRALWPQLRKRLRVFSLASFCIETASQFAQEGDHDGARLYAPLRACLQSLNDASSNADANRAANYFSLQLLSVAGFSPLHAEIDIKPEIRDWWQQLLVGNTDAPLDAALLRESFVVLSGLAENIIGHQLKTRTALVGNVD